MSPRPGWLPDLVEMSDYGGDWARYEAALYRFFHADFIVSKPRFRGQAVNLKRHPIIQGKEATYWHCISTGEVEAERLPDLRRSERIRWPRPCIEHETELRVWTEPRNGEDRIHLWLESEGYLVVLAARRGYVVLWTTFFVEREHERKKYARRYQEAQKRLMPPRGTAS